MEFEFFRSNSTHRTQPRPPAPCAPRTTRSAFAASFGVGAALAATLDHYARGEAVEAIPVWRMIAADPGTLAQRAQAWADACGAHASTLAAQSTVGGGTLPGEELPTTVCAVDPPEGGADAFATALRAATPPIVARIAEDRVLLDPRTVDPSEDVYVAATLMALCGTPGGEAPAGR